MYKNSNLLATRNISAWRYADDPGYLGLWFASASGHLLDDFGGGNISTGATVTPATTLTPSRTPTRTNTPAVTNTPSRTPTASLTPTLPATPTATPIVPFSGATFLYDGDGNRVAQTIMA